MVLEAQAQGHIGWTPYDRQLRLQAFSHLANGADGMLYWHWHSLHNGCETYWRGLLGHDMRENRVYREICTIGRDFQRIGSRLLHLKKENKAAILVSNESLNALSGFPMFHMPVPEVGYNDIVRQCADALYELNLEYDVVWPEERDFSAYQLLVVPALYSAPEDLLVALSAYVRQGGTLLATCRSGYANEYLTVYHQRQPCILWECLGTSYQEYTVPEQVSLDIEGSFPEGAGLSQQARQVRTWMEFLQPEEASVLARYQHPFWKDFAAITEHSFGSGTGIYAGCMLTDECLKQLMVHAAKRAGLGGEITESYPVVVRSGVNLIERLQKEQYREKTLLTVRNPWIAAFQKHSRKVELTAGLVKSLVERITVYGENRMEIQLKYRDERAALLAALEQSGEKVSA